MNDIIQEIAASSKKQSSGVEEINKDLMQVNEVIQNSPSISEETAHASDELSKHLSGSKPTSPKFGFA